MKKIALILIMILIFITILYFPTNSTINQEQESYQPPICGNNICEEGEGSYCLDCNLSCKSELCNSKINVICSNCTEIQEILLPTFFEHQIIAYDCLTDYYNYHPSRLIYHTITKGIQDEPCNKKQGCYIRGGGLANQEGIAQSFIPGLREYNKTDVTKKENIGFEIHELAHVFTRYGLGIVPSWFTEGISIYTESKILCHPDYILSNKINEFSLLYEQLKRGDKTLTEIAPYDEYYKTEYDPHRIGSMYFIALEQDYNCNKECISKILHSLYKYRENCTEVCFEDSKKSVPQLTNFSLNNNDLRIQIITNKIIKQKSEEFVGEDLTLLFELLKIEF